MKQIPDALKRVVRGIYARHMYLTLSQQIRTMILNNRTKEARRLTRYKKRLGQILFDK